MISKNKPPKRKATRPMNPRKSGNATKPVSFIILFSLVITWIFNSSQVNATSIYKVSFSDVAVFFQFGIQATFQARLESKDAVDEIVLLIQSGAETPISQPLKVAENNEVIFQLDLMKNSLRPFEVTEYWFKGRLSDGTTFESEHYSFDYIDNRFDWQATTDGRFEVFWNSDDLALGDMVLQVALEGLRSGVTYLPVSPPLPIRIFVYSSGKDLQDALQLGHLTWIAGHASPDLNLALISLPPAIEQRLELERQLPHEIMHILQYQVIADHYESTPPWLTEGLASLAELYPNPDYSRSLEQATLNGSLLPMKDLCNDFPIEASLALQAYAQSASFVQFLSDQYGISALQTLLQKYGDGMDCDSAVQNIYGSDLSHIENLWKQEVLGINTGVQAWRKLSPYVFLAALLSIPSLIVITLHRRKKAVTIAKDGE
jgi:hypothetical protein